jgi:hypothetical protein
MGIQNNDKANWQIKVLARIQRDCPWYQGCTLTSEQNPKSHRKMVALELDTNDGHGTIKREPAPRKRENWIENHEPILNPNQLFDLAISNWKTIRAIYIYIYMWKGRGNHGKTDDGRMLLRHHTVGT